MMTQPHTWVNCFFGLLLSIRMVSLGRKEGLLNWIWIYGTKWMYGFYTLEMPTPNEPRHNNFLHTTYVSASKQISLDKSSPPANSNPFENFENYEFQPSHESILVLPILNYVVLLLAYIEQEKKSVSFIYSTPLNMCYLKVNGNRRPSISRNNNDTNANQQ